MRFIIVVLALLCSPAYAMAGFIPCQISVPLYKQVRESNDERVSAIFADVVQRTHMTDKKFALCESDEFLPGIFPASKDLNSFVLVLPRIIGMLTDEELEGLIAHELGHAKKTGLRRREIH